MSTSSVDSNDTDSQLEKVQQALARMVCNEGVRPQSFCHDQHFGRIIDTLNPKLRSCLTFKSLEQNCMKIYKVEQEKVKETFSKLGRKISVSVDLLLHEKFDSVDEYVCISAHFIDDDWKLRKWVVEYCRRFDTDINFPSNAILKSLKEYDIENKLLIFTSAETGPLAECVKVHLLDITSFPLDRRLFHVQCSCDMISRMVQKGFKLISEIIDKAEMVSMSKPLPLWHLTSSKLSEVLKSKYLRKKVLSAEEQEKARTVCTIADRIYEIVKGLFEVKSPTANLFLPHMQEIRAYLAEQSASSDAFVKLVTKKMCKVFDKYWVDTYLVLSIAAFFDPRYKMKYVEFVLCDDLEAAVVLNTIREIYDVYVFQTKEYELSESSSQSSDEDEGEEGEEDEIMEVDVRSNEMAKKGRVNILEPLNGLKDYCESMQPMDDSMDVKSDLDWYLEEPVFPWKGNFSVLQWWKDNRYKYPRLACMAQDFLAIPLTVATCSKAYYTDPRDADKTVVSLKPDLMNALMCTRSWKVGYGSD
ncbi:unnamed protein product [Amaranthus hypochondriacus]